MNQSLTERNSKPKFSVILQSDGIKKLINNTLGDPKRAMNFVTSISSAVAINPLLQDCEPNTIISAALVGESLGLSPSTQLGHYYLVPFNDKVRGKVATFQIGYKGYIQLAMRSGQYKKLNVLSIKTGELVKYDPLNEEIEVNLIEDDEKREATPTTGYYAMFEYLNGFRKTMYWSVKKMTAHAKKYSQGYRSDLEKGNNWTFWSKDFDGMAYKTMLRQLISKWGIMSIEMQKAFETDMGAIGADGKVDYVDNSQEEFTPELIAPKPIEPVTPEKPVEPKEKTLIPAKVEILSQHVNPITPPQPKNPFQELAGEQITLDEFEPKAYKGNL